MKIGDQETIGNCSNRNGRHSKKPKPKKVPQRGLGVAQLEKIRLEEEVKNDAANLPSLALTPHPFDRHSGSYLFPRDNLFEHVPYNSHLNLRHQSIGALSFTPPNNGYSGNNLLSSTYIQEAEKSTRLPQNHNPPCRPMTLKSTNTPLLRGNQQSSSFSSLMVNDVAENSSYTVLSSQTEPPSNQSPYGTYRSFQPGEAEKTILSKRPYPFSLLDPSKTSPHCKFNPSPSTVPDNPGSLVITGNPNLRAESRTTEGGFLKLASPSTMSFFPSSESKQALSYPHTYQAAELLKQCSTSSNKQVCVPNLDSQVQRQSFHMFFPETNITRNGQSAGTTTHHEHEPEEKWIDLDLKL